MPELLAPTTDELLEKSAATESFRAALKDFESNHQRNETINFGSGNPPVKVLRVVSGILENFPDLEIETVEVNGRSGCSDYRGTAIVNGETKIDFVWDCAWKAQQLGWTDFFGNPDQIRAARTYGYQCFERMEIVS